MSFKKIKGNEKAIERMRKAIEKGNIFHAYIFEGDSYVDKNLVAETFAKAILCDNNSLGGGQGDSCDDCPSCHKVDHGNHEDLIYVSANGTSIKDEAIEELQGRIKKKPYVGSRNVVVIQNADSMTLRAQNRLLKTLEEPPGDTVMIILSENMENLTKTVRSRCILYRLNPFEAEMFQESLAEAIDIENMMFEEKSFYEISQKLTEQSTTKQKAHLFLDALESWYRDIGVCEYDQNGNIVINVNFIDEIEKKSKLYKKADIYNAVACIEEARIDLNRNINISYTLKNMVLKIGG